MILKPIEWDVIENGPLYFAYFSDGKFYFRIERGYVETENYNVEDKFIASVFENKKELKIGDFYTAAEAKAAIEKWRDNQIIPLPSDDIKKAINIGVRYLNLDLDIIERIKKDDN